MATGGSPRSVEPVFLRKRDLPTQFDRHGHQINERYSALNICLAAEKISGRETIHGAQDIKGLWRIYPLTRSARDKLLIEGIEIGGQSFTLHNRNPYLISNGNGIEIPTTKLWVSDIPISVDDADIEGALLREGCVLRSKLMMDKIRTKEGKLTRFVTGKRFVFINLPNSPLSRTVQVGDFTARLYYREQPKQNSKPAVCSKCLESGHHVSVCQNQVTCRACRVSGHKQGDPVCGSFSDPSDFAWHFPSITPTHSDLRETTDWDSGSVGKDEAQRKKEEFNEDEEEKDRQEETKEKIEDQDDQWEDSLSEIQMSVPAVKTYSQSGKVGKGRMKTSAGPHDSALSNASQAQSGGPLTPNKRARSPAGDSPNMQGGTLKQVRLDEVMPGLHAPGNLT